MPVERGVGLAWEKACFTRSGAASLMKMRELGEYDPSTYLSIGPAGGPADGGWLAVSNDLAALV